ncbi:MAG: hypothetical protein ACK5EA_08825 [Planctomycetaceae bacterium]
MLVSALRALDKILRGDATRLAELQTGRLDISLRQIVPVLLLLAALYGAAMGLFGTLHLGQPQLFVNLLKVPCLFLFTLLVTFPSLCVFNILVGSRLSTRTLLNMFVVSLGVMIVVLASLAPILVFFTLSTRSHPFMVLLNGLNVLIAAAWGRSFLVQTLHGLLLAEESNTSASPGAGRPEPGPPTELKFEETPATSPPDAVKTEAPAEPTLSTGNGDPAPTTTGPSAAVVAPPSTGVPTSAPARRSAVARSPAPAPARSGGEVLSPVAKVRGVLRTWLFIFVAVGLQMTWILGPLVGNPQGDFVWFHPPGEGNFLQGFWTVLTSLFG